MVSVAGSPSVSAARGAPLAAAPVSQGGTWGTSSPGVRWAVLLLCAICFEGWARKVLSFIPSGLFYLSKDMVLLAWLAQRGFRKDVVEKVKGLMGPSASGLLAAALAWTFLNMFNPAEESVLDGLFGMRAYWLWWAAPLAVAGMLRTEQERRRVMVIFVAIALVTAVYAYRQFQSPGTDEINQYANFGVRKHTAVTMVATTKRVRVTSTFSYITGFSDFVQLAFLFMLSQIPAAKGPLRLVLTGGLLAIAVATPMTGSRSPLVIIAAGTLVILWTSGLIRSAGGRRMLIGSAAVLALMPVLVPEAVQGVLDRFGDSNETQSRFLTIVQNVPFLAPFAIADQVALSAVGTGTGTQQNMVALNRSNGVFFDYEPGRLVVELGVPGYLVYSMLRVLLARAVWVMAARLSRRGRKGEAGLARILVVLTFLGQLVFDHIFQALYFFMVGYLLSVLVEAEAPRPTA